MVEFVNIGTLAGNGRLGDRGDGGSALDAELNRPHGLAIAPDGSICFTEYFGACVRRITSDGMLGRVAGRPGESGFGGDGGLASDALFGYPYGITIGPTGAVFVSDDENLRIRRISPDGSITTIAGTGEIGDTGDGGLAIAATFNALGGLSLGQDGSLFIADPGNARVRRIDPNGVITTIAGTGHRGAVGDGGPADAAQLYQPVSVTATEDGQLYISDAAANRVRRVRTNGIIETVAGNGERGSGGDGKAALEAQLNAPVATRVGPDGTLYIAELVGNRIRAVSPNGLITTVVGTGEMGFGGDGGIPRLAMLARPRDIALDDLGNLYISDSENNRIRKVSVAER